MNNRTKAALCLVGALLCIGGAGVITRVFMGSWVEEPPTAAAGPALSLKVAKERPSTEASFDAPEPQEEVQQYAYLTGAVVNPGTYPISKNYRLFQLIDDAGGLRWDAASEQINMAAPVHDGEHIHVPTFVPSSDEKKESSSSSGSRPTSNSKSSGSSQSVAKGEKTPVNVNTASEEELCLLPGVGPVIAERIVEYRKSHGPFSDPDDLKNVSGIGDGRLSAMRSLLRF